MEGSLVNVRVTLRAVSGAGGPALAGARGELLKLGLTEAGDGAFVGRGAVALRFWREGMGSLPDAWELSVPETLVGRFDASRAREPLDMGRVRTFAARLSAEPNDERAVAILATKEGRWFVAETFGRVALADAHEQARLDTLLARMIERGGARAMQRLEADLSKWAMATKKKAAEPAEPASKPPKKAPVKKPKIGRPPRAGKAAAESVRVRLTRAEREEIERAAKRAGKAIAAFMRDASLSVAKSS